MLHMPPVIEPSDPFLKALKSNLDNVPQVPADVPIDVEKKNFGGERKYVRSR